MSPPLDRRAERLSTDRPRRLERTHVVDATALENATGDFLKSNKKCACGRLAVRVTLPQTRELDLLMNRRLWRAVCGSCDAPGA